MSRKQWLTGAALVIAILASGALGFLLAVRSAPTTSAWESLPQYNDTCDKPVLQRYDGFFPTHYTRPDRTSVYFAMEVMQPLHYYAGVPLGASCTGFKWTKAPVGDCTVQRLENAAVSWCPTDTERFPPRSGDPSPSPLEPRGSFSVDHDKLTLLAEQDLLFPIKAVFEAYADYLVLTLHGQSAPSTAAQRACYVGVFAEALNRNSLVDPTFMAGIRSHYPGALFDQGAYDPRSCRST